MMSEQAASPTSLPTNPLSERELEVAQELVTGASNAEIARTLIISPHTVKVHVRNIFEKLEVNSRTEATMVLLQKGWVTVPGVSPISDEALVPDAPDLDDLAIRPFAWQRIYMLGALILILLAFWAPTLNSRSAEPVDLLSDSSLGVIGAPVVTTLPRWEARTPLTSARSRLAGAVLGETLYALGGEGKTARRSIWSRPTICASTSGRKRPLCPSRSPTSPQLRSTVTSTWPAAA